MKPTVTSTLVCCVGTRELGRSLQHLTHLVCLHPGYGGVKAHPQPKDGQPNFRLNQYFFSHSSGLDASGVHDVVRGPMEGLRFGQAKDAQGPRGAQLKPARGSSPATPVLWSTVHA